MNKDIRVATSFLTHRKRKKLQRALGADGVLAFLDLLLSVAICRPDGVLSGMDKDDIALDAQWNGDEDEFVDTLVGIGFLDVDAEGTYFIHNWIEHNEYAAGAPDRSKKAAKAAQKRWGGKKSDTSHDKEVMPDNASGNAKTCREHAGGIAKTCNRHASGSATSEKGSKKPKNIPLKTSNKNKGLMLNDARSNAKVCPEQCSTDATASNGQCPSLLSSSLLREESTPPPQAERSPLGSPSVIDFKKSLDIQQSKHFASHVGSLMELISRACEEIERLPAKRGKPFNPWQCVQKSVNEGGHPQAILESLRGLIDYWDGAVAPWGYFRSVMTTKNKNCWERDSMAKAGSYKEAINDLVASGSFQQLLQVKAM